MTIITFITAAILGYLSGVLAHAATRETNTPAERLSPGAWPGIVRARGGFNGGEFLTVRVFNASIREPEHADKPAEDGPLGGAYGLDDSELHQSVGGKAERQQGVLPGVDDLGQNIILVAGTRLQDVLHCLYSSSLPAAFEELRAGRVQQDGEGEDACNVEETTILLTALPEEALSRLSSAKACRSVYESNAEACGCHVYVSNQPAHFLQELHALNSTTTQVEA